MARPHLRDPGKERHWRQLLARWQRSGLTVRDFCAQIGCSEPSFYSWRRELQRRDRVAPAAAPPAFVPVRVVPDALPVPAAPALEVLLPGGVVLRLPAGSDLAWLGQLLRHLEQPSC